MFQTSRHKSTVGLEIEAGSIAAVEVAVNGTARVTRHGVVPLAPGVFREGEVTDPDALSAALKELFGAHSLSKQVRLGVSNQRVVVRRMSLPAIDDPKDLDAAVRFQAQEQIPMPLESAMLDWVVDGERRGENGERLIDVVVVAARREMLTALAGAMRAAGLRPVGIDLSAFGMVRALAGTQPGATPPASPPATAAPSAPTEPIAIAHQEPPPADAPTEVAGEAQEPQQPTQLFCSLGDVLTLAVARGDSCLFARVSPFGIEGIAQRLAEQRRLAIDHARQWLQHVGLDRPLAEVEGDPQIVAAASQTLVEGVTKLAEEIRLSLQAYSAQPQASKIDSVLVCGTGAAIPGVVDRIGRDLGHPVVVGRPAPLVALGPAALRLTVPFGLALEEAA